MSDMNFQLVLELITKGLDGFNKAVKAEKDLETAGKAANDKTIEGAKKAEAAINAEMKAIEKATAAMKAEQAAAKATAGAQAEAAREAEKSTGVLHRLGETARSAGSAMASGFHKATSAAASAGRAITSTLRGSMRGGMGLGKELAKGVGAGFKAEWPNILKAVMGGMFGGGVGFMSGPGGLRSNVQALTQRAISGGAMATRAASVMAYSNVRGALNAEEQMRPDLGVEGAARARAAADAWLKTSPFRRDDVRAALPDAAKAGVMPGTKAWQAVMDAAASQQVSPQQAMAAYAAAKKGDMSGLEAFGIAGKTDDDGKLKALSFMAGGQQQNMAVSGNADGQILAALEARFAGAGDRKSMSIEGVITRAINQWDAFVGKVMDSGPYQFMSDKFAEVFKAMQLDSGGAEQLGKSITDAMRGASEIVKDVYQGFKTIQPAVASVVSALGGWKTAIEGALVAWLALKAVSIASSFAGMVAGIVAMTAALGPAAAAAWAFAAALLANPVTWIVAGIIALAAAIYLLWKNWDKVGPAISAGWEAIKSAMSSGASEFGSLLSGAWDGVKEKAVAAWDGIKAAVSDAWNGWKTLATNNLMAVSDAITSWGATALSAIKSAFGPVSDWFEGAMRRISGLWDNVSGAVKKAASYVGLGKEETPEEKALASAGQASAALTLLNELQAKMSEVQAAVSTFDLAGPINAAINVARGAVAGQSFHAEGVALMNTLAAGIEAGAARAVAAVRNVAQQMRDHLPHSPAKVGPLSDLDQVRFSETLASAIRPDPAVAAVRSVAAGMRAAIGDGPQIGVGAAAGAAGGVAAGQGGSGPISLTLAPVIHGVAGGDARGIVEQLRPFAYELADMVRRELRQDARLNYREA